MTIHEWDNDGQGAGAYPSSPPSGHQSTGLLASGCALKRLQGLLTTFKGKDVRFGGLWSGGDFSPPPSLPDSRTDRAGASFVLCPGLYNAPIVGRVAGNG